MHKRCTEKTEQQKRAGGRLRNRGNNKDRPSRRLRLSTTEGRCQEIQVNRASISWHNPGDGGEVHYDIGAKLAEGASRRRGGRRPGAPGKSGEPPQHEEIAGVQIARKSNDDWLSESSTGISYKAREDQVVARSAGEASGCW